MTTRRLIIIIFLISLVPLIISACSDSSNISGLRKEQGSLQASVRGVPGDMIAFEGHVFVASTQPENNLWQSAGWQIASQPIAGDEESVPADCTLYPHQGVDDQWIGSCDGYTYIPSAGANHIAVIHTQIDGTTRMVQVAPPPVASDP